MKARILAVLTLATALAGCARHEADDTAPAAGKVAVMTSAEARLPAVLPAVVRFARAVDRGSLALYPAARVVRQDGAYTWHRADISEAYARRAMAEGELAITAPSGELLRFRFDRHVEHPNGDWTWVGSINGDPSQQAIVTFGDQAAFGTIAQPGKEPLRLTIQNGVSWLVETDPRRIAGIVNAATRPKNPDFLIAPDLARGIGRRTSADAPLAASSGNAAMAAATGTAATTVDLVLGYTTGFAAGLGGDSQAQTRLNYLVDVTNESYANSQVDARVRVVKMVAVSYPDATANQTALEELTGFKAPSTQTTPNAAFSALRSARDQYGADLVSLVRKFNVPENDGCGIAWLIGGGRTGIDSGDEFFGYSVVSDGNDVGTDGKTYYCRDETLAHELGHNMGAAHDRDTSDGDDNVLQSNEYGVFAYSFGYKTTAANGNFYTVMGYGDSGQTRYRVFSNPRTTFCGGLACGVTDQADNARTLTQTLPTVATFRATVAVSPPTSARRVSNDVNGDGRSDVLWLNAQLARFSYWLMNGSTVVSQTGVSAPAGYRIATTGDFNADGYLDILWTSGAKDLHLWLGNGSSFASTRMYDYCCGWEVVGSGDVNADGKDDLLWHNAATGYFSYWIMDGARVVSQVGYPIGVGYRMAAASDFNGDGRVDLVWTSSANDLWMWAGNGTSFTSTRLYNYCCDWQVVGAKDVNGDGKGDLLWHNPREGLFSYWLMNGAAVMSQVGMPITSGYRMAAAGDYNGDGMADLLWTSNANDLWIWVGNGSTFSSARLYDYCCSWQPVKPSFH